MRSSGKRASRLWGSDAALGIAVIALVGILLAALAVVYTRPPSQKDLTFETTDASAIETGQDIRVAGISIGKVSELRLDDQVVRVRARVDSSTRIGDRSRIEVRMLTPVGGYAITVIPAGAGNTAAVIPADRVSVPYSIGDVLQEAPTLTDEVDSSTVNANLDQVADAFTSNPTSLGSIVGGLDAITGVFERQRTQVHRVAALASEYLGTFNANREFVFELIGKIDTVVTTYHNNSAGFNYTYRLLGRILGKLMPFEKFYLKNSDTVRQHVYAMRDAITALQKQLGPAIDGLLATRQQLADWITPRGIADMGGGTLWTSKVCVPVPGKGC